MTNVKISSLIDYSFLMNALIFKGAPPSILEKDASERHSSARLLSMLPRQTLISTHRAYIRRDRARGFSIFQYSLYATWSVTGLRTRMALSVSRRWPWGWQEGKGRRRGWKASLATAPPPRAREKEGEEGERKRERGWEGRRERSAVRLIYISCELSRLRYFRGARYRELSAGFRQRPQWALNIHQFPADICVTSALQPAWRVSAIGNTNAFFFVLPRVSSWLSSFLSSRGKNVRG